MKALTKSNIKNLNKLGVYKIYFYKNSTPVPISRIVKLDNSGLIYIGCTKKQNFEKRLNNFILSSKKIKTNNHSGGNKISLYNVLSKFFSDGILMFEAIEHPSPLEEERALIKKYQEEFGEKPPLNG